VPEYVVGRRATRYETARVEATHAEVVELDRRRRGVAVSRRGHRARGRARASYAPGSAAGGTFRSIPGCSSQS
jgi:hypothetical protein